MAKTQPWFSVNGRPGDRTLDQQLRGLERLWPEVAGKSVLDVGCAEGLISIECAKRGASMVDGVEIRPSAVVAARNARDQQEVNRKVCQFFVSDVTEYMTEARYDVVLMLAVLHKLRDPSASCKRLAAGARDLVVIRLPPAGAPMIADPRSNYMPHNIGRVMTESGFVLEHAGNDGPFGEWVGYYRRVK